MLINFLGLSRLNLTLFLCGGGKECKFCGRIHKPRECPAYGQEYCKCKRKNHWASCCMTKKVHEACTRSDDDFVIGTVEAALKEKSAEALAILKINNKKVKIKLDTAAEVNVMPVRVFKERRWSCQDGTNENKALWTWWNKYSSGRKDQGDVWVLRCKTLIRIICGENKFQDSTQFIDINRIRNDTNTQ